MAENRRGISPWSIEREAGIQSATVDSNITVPQIMQPTLDSGFIDERGQWKGNKSSDEVFIAFSTEEAVANSGAILTPGVNPDGTWPLDMTGYIDLMFAINVTNVGNYKIGAVMGPDSVNYANLSPVDPAVALKGYPIGDDPTDMTNLMDDAAEELVNPNVWYIFSIMGRLRNQKLLQFKVTNNSGDVSTINTAFMRLV